MSSLESSATNEIRKSQHKIPAAKSFSDGFDLRFGRLHDGPLPIITKRQLTVVGVGAMALEAALKIRSGNVYFRARNQGMKRTKKLI